MSKERFAKAMSALAEYYGKPMNSAVMSLYWQGLQSYSIEAIEDAIGRHLRNPDTGMWMPKIADIVKMMEGSTQDAAVLAWAKVMRATGSVGQYQSIAFDDPLIHAAIDDIGGWPFICQTKEDELPFVQRRFEQNYRAYKTRSDVPTYPKYLVGICEIQNAGRGFKSPMPRLAGNPEAAALVMKNGSETPRLTVTPGELVVSPLLHIANKAAA